MVHALQVRQLLRDLGVHLHLLHRTRRPVVHRLTDGAKRPSTDRRQFLELLQIRLPDSQHGPPLNQERARRGHRPVLPQRCFQTLEKLRSCRKSWHVGGLKHFGPGHIQRSVSILGAHARVAAQCQQLRNDVLPLEPAREMKAVELPGGRSAVHQVGHFAQHGQGCVPLLDLAEVQHMMSRRVPVLLLGQLPQHLRRRPPGRSDLHSPPRRVPQAQPVDVRVEVQHQLHQGRVVAEYYFMQERLDRPVRDPIHELRDQGGLLPASLSHQHTAQLLNLSGRRQLQKPQCLRVPQPITDGPAARDERGRQGSPRLIWSCEDARVRVVPKQRRDDLLLVLLCREVDQGVAPGEGLGSRVVAPELHWESLQDLLGIGPTAFFRFIQHAVDRRRC
mmetsp:Transcript_59755/g.159918  ORF Transcript_59755/g.159918 Transcript_59755/m.159918 type:complete len:390 (-) Transcript_59755:185-1354(-)